MFETFNYNGKTFTIWFELDYYILVVDDSTYLFDTMENIEAFISQYEIV